MAEKIAITGAPGWLGTTLAQALAEGTEFRSIRQDAVPIRCVVQPGVSTQPLDRLGGDVESLSADLRDPAALQGLSMAVMRLCMRRESFTPGESRTFLRSTSRERATCCLRPFERV